MRVRVRTLLLVVALVGLAIGTGRWLVRRHAYCRAQASRYAASAEWYKMQNQWIASTRQWTPIPPVVLREEREHAELGIRHAAMARRYQESATRFWVPLPSTPSEADPDVIVPAW